MVEFVSCLAQIIMSGLILVLSVMGGIYENPYYFLVGAICAVCYYVAFNLAEDVSFSIQDYFICDEWEVFGKKFAWANTATFVVFIVCYLIFIQ